MAVPVIMPRQGQSVETCIITRWYKNKGDQVKTGDVLFSYETDKAAFDAESPADGTLLGILVPEGDEAPVLSNVAVIGKEGEDISEFTPGTSEARPEKPAPDPVPEPAAPVMTEPVVLNEGKTRISPRAKNMAAQMGIDIKTIKGSGPNGRIIARDIEQSSASGSKPAAQAVSHIQSFATAYTDTPLSNVRKIIARSMHESLSSSAQLTHHMSADARKILAFRAAIKKNPGDYPQKITINDMVCFAVVKALLKFPEINSHFLGHAIRTFSKVHLGLAVDTPRGLMVATVRDASDLSLTGLSSRLAESAEACRKGNINPELLASTSASFTVSNLGNYGVEMFTPVINLPQSAILGVNTITHRPAEIQEGVFAFVPFIGLSLTYDHRSVDGGPATRFLKEICTEIENFEYR